MEGTTVEEQRGLLPGSASPATPADLAWPFWPALPLYPYGRRRTLRRELIPDMLWTFDQIQGLLNVVVPIRMSVVRLSGGGLFVYAPVAPTPECVRLMRELEARHGEVRYIVLPTVSGIEHKIFVGPFARHFRRAQVFVAPHQWSFPLNLPLSWLGLPAERTAVLSADSSKTPFADAFDYALLGPVDLRLGRFAEAAFFHRPTRTLLVTDTLVSVPAVPPEIVALDPYPLLFHAKDSARERVSDTEATRRKGWQRIALFTFFFQPGRLATVPFGRLLREALQAPEHSRRACFGLFPFDWQPGWEQSFERLRAGGRPFVAPVLQTLILNRAPAATLAWVERVARWDFERIVPCHFDAPIAAGPRELRSAFAFLERPALPEPFASEDLALMRRLDTGLSRLGIIPPARF